MSVILNSEEQKPLLDFQKFCIENLKSRPLIVAALSPEFDESFQLIENKKFAEIIEPYNRKVYYKYFCLPLLVYWVRKFYEDSNGLEAYNMLGVNQSTWIKFLQTCRDNRECKPWVNDLHAFPRRGQNTKEWLRRQCWLLKASKHGKNATRLKNNASVYSCLQESFFEAPDMEWAQLFNSAEQLETKLQKLELLKPFFQIQREQDIPAYIRDVFTTYRSDFLLSIKALTSEEQDKPEVLPDKWRWLETIWEIGKYEMIKVSRTMPYLRPIWKLELNGDILNLYIHITCSEGISITLMQGDVIIREGLQGECKLLVKDLHNFDISQPLLIRGTVQDSRITIPKELCFCPGEWMLFRATENGLSHTNECEYKTSDIYVRPDRTFWLIHRQGEIISATLDGKKCITHGHHRKLLGKWVGQLFSFPDRLDHPYGADFIVNGRFVSRFVERPNIRIVESGVPEDVEIDETDIPGVGGGHRLASGTLRFEGSGSFEKDGEYAGESGPYPDDHQWLIPLGEKSLHQAGVRFSHKRGGKVVWKKDIFVLREDWRNLIVPDSPTRRLEAYKYQKKDAMIYTIPETGEQVHLLTPAEKPFFCWSRRRRNDEQTAEVCLRLNDNLSLKDYNLDLFLPCLGSCVEMSIVIGDKKKMSRIISDSKGMKTKIKKALREVCPSPCNKRVHILIEHQEILVFDCTPDIYQQLI